MALVRVVTYHAFGWIWLPAVFPSMGIMFAMAGSLVAASLDRSPGNPWAVLAKRTRRLLPPLWAFGIVIVPIMLWHGWTVTEAAGIPLRWDTAWLWVLPLSDPPASAWGSDWVLPLWYIRTYLWFLLLSPAFLWLFRHWPKRVLALPLVTLILATLGVLTLSGPSGGVILSLSIFGACWLTGFAHHDGTLRRARRSVVVGVGVALMAAGLAWAFAHPDPVSGPDIDDVPLSDALYGLGFVVILLRFYPDFSWMARRPVLDKLVTMINTRAMTIYLWANVAIFCSHPLADLWSVTAAWDTESVGGRIQMYLLSWVCIAIAVLAFGWVEDVAARRPVRINPWPRDVEAMPTTQRATAITRVTALATAAAAPAVVWGRRHRPTRPEWWPQGRTPSLLFGTVGLVLVAAVYTGVAAQHGTSTQVVTTDTPSKYAEQPRVEAPRPANLAQPGGQKFAAVESAKQFLAAQPTTTSRSVPEQAGTTAPRTSAVPVPTISPTPTATASPTPTVTASPTTGTTPSPTTTTKSSPTTTTKSSPTTATVPRTTATGPPATQPPTPVATGAPAAGSSSSVKAPAP